jgi:sodium/potassium-transporting ATPase subunit alpha
MDNTLIPLDEEFRKKISAQAEAYENEAYRVLAIAMGEGESEESMVLLGLIAIMGEGESEESMVLLGLIAIMDLPRAEVSGAVAICKKAGIRTMMITGDNAHTAAAIARKIGMEYERVINGDELEKINDDT